MRDRTGVGPSSRGVVLGVCDRDTRRLQFRVARSLAGLDASSRALRAALTRQTWPAVVVTIKSPGVKPFWQALLRIEAK